MLTNDQIAQVKAANATSAGAATPSQGMTPEQAKAWINEPAPTPQSHIFENIGKWAGPVGGAVGQLMDNPGAVKEAFGQGVQQAEQGYQQVQNAKNPLELLEGAAAQGAGAFNAAFSPITPAMKPVGDATNTVADKISDIPAVQKFAMGKGGDIALRAATDVGNLDTIAMGVTAGPKVGGAAADLGSATAKGVNDWAARVEQSKAQAKLPPTPEAKMAAHIDQQGKAYSAIEDEVRNTAAKYPKVMTALNNAEVVRHTKPIEVLSSYAQGKALPTLIKGKLQVEAATQFLTKKVGDLSKIKDQLVKSSPTKTPVENFQGRVNAIIDAKSWSQAKKIAMKADAQKITNPWKDIYPDGIPNGELDNLKTEETGESTSYNSKSPFSLDAHGAVGQAARQLVQGNAEHAPIDELNKVISSHYDAIKLLNSMRGYTPHGGALSKMLRGTGGEIAGLAAGMVVGHPFLGAMAGRAGAEAITEVINNHFISNPLKRTLVNNMNGADPGVVQKALDYLDEKASGSPQGESTNTAPPDTQTMPESNSSPNDSIQGESVKPINQNPEAGFIKNPLTKNDAGITEDTGKIAGTIDQQLKASEEVFKEYTPEMLAKNGGLPSFLKTMQQNISLELKAEGFPAESAKVAGLDLNKYPTFDAFKKDLQGMRPSAAPKPGLEMKGGWKSNFDNALAGKDAARVQELLPYVPDYYKARFEKEIGDVLKKNDEFAGQRGFIKNPFAHEEAQSGLRPGQPPIGSDWNPTTESRINLDETVARERFDIPNLKKVSFGGSDRDVYELPSGNVLKVAKTSRGLDQNAFSSDYYAEDAGLIPNTIEKGKNYIVKERVNPPDENTKRMIAEINKLDTFSLNGKMGGYNRAFAERQKAYQIMDKYGYPGDDLANYDPMWGDISAVRNWGTKDGKPILIDEGTLDGSLVENAKKSATGGTKNLNDPEFRAAYDQSRAAKKKFGDTDAKTMYGIGAGVIPLIASQQQNQ